jgi:phosphonate transport system substrate-binding protein
MREKDVIRSSEGQTVASAGLGAPAHKVLAANFTYRQSRLLADPPESAAQFIDPKTLVVAHIEGADATPGKSWAEFESQLAAATRRKVVDEIYTNSATQVADIDSGKVTLLALHAADAPFLVNNYGFQPMAVLGRGAGINGHRLDLIVPAKSQLASASDLKGHRLVCTVPSSITGYRAATAYLMRDCGLRPNVDYEIIWSTSQKRSIAGIAEKKFEMAAVSDDKVNSMLAKGEIQSSQYKIVYQSQVVPRTVIGYFYNLNPELAEQLRKAILPTSATTAPDVLDFMPIDYKRDFQFVREIDDAFDPRFDAKTAKSSQTD